MLRTALTLFLSSLVSSGLVNAAEEMQSFQISAQSLNNALMQFAVASHLELIFTADLVRGINARALSGNMRPAQALTELLQNTGISYRFIDAKTVTLIRQNAAAAVEKPTPEPGQAIKEAAESALPAEPVTLANMDVIGEVVADNRSYFVAESASATNTSTPIKAVPQSVHVIPKSLTADQQNIVISESLNNVSGVITRNPLFAPVVEGTLIRGFGAEQLVDGFTQYYNPGDRESNVNIDKIEVLKGANAVFYSGGSGATAGGVINLASKLPKAQALTELGGKIGSNNFYQSFLDVNRPLTDWAQFRLTGEYTHSGSHIDVVQTQRYNINPSLLIANDSTRLTIQGKVSKWRQPEYQGLPAVGSVTGRFKIPQHTFIGPTNIPDSISAANAVWAGISHKLDEIWTFNFKARYALSEFIEKNQYVINLLGSIDEPSVLPSTWTLINGELFQKQQELSFQGHAAAKFNWAKTENTVLLGADRSELDDHGYFDIDYGPQGLGVGSVDLQKPVYTSPYKKPGPGINNSFVKNISYGGYGQLQSTLYQRVHLLVSLRLGTVFTDYKSTADGTLVTAVTDKTKLLPRAGAVLDLTDELSVFAGFSEGMRGQPYAKFLSAANPEYSQQLEAGLKFDFAGQFSGQLAVYQIERSNVAVKNPKQPGYVTAAGQQRSQGFEADVLWQPSQALSVLANYAHTDARFQDNLAGVPAGNRRARVPEHSGRLWANYRFQQPVLQGFSVGGGVYLQSEAFLADDNRFKTEAFHSFDAAVAYETKRFRVAATIKNLTDAHYFEAYSFLAGHVVPAAGTSVYATASVKF
ncbi:MAG: TonB-dependent receptor [Methylococcales bacterium]